MENIKEIIQKKFNEKKKVLLKAAINVFAQKGYLKTQMLEVANAAKVAKGTVYLYFKNKDDLFMQAIHEVEHSQLLELKKRVEKFKTAFERLTNFLYMNMDIFLENPNVTKFVVNEFHQSQEFKKKHPTYNPYAEYIEFLKHLIEESIAENSLKKVNSTVLAHIVVGTMEQILLQWLKNPTVVNARSMVADAQDILFCGIIPQPGGSQ